MKRSAICRSSVFIGLANFTFTLLFLGHITSAFVQTPRIIKGRGFAKSDNNSSVCKESNGQFADPKYCDKYYDCWDSKPVSSGQCSHGLMFNEETSSCDYPSNVNCEGKEVAQPPQNLDEGCEKPYGKFANPNNCTKYTVCHAGMATHFSCHEGLAFDKETEECAPPHNPLCLESNLPNDRPEGEGIEELPLDPDNIKPVPPPSGPADDGSHFPVPDWPKVTKCPASASSGFFPVTVDCQSVVVCINGNGYLFSCPQGKYYDPRAARCKPGNKRNCEQMQNKVPNHLSIKMSGMKVFAYFKPGYPLFPTVLK